jgi:hypothetical protein
MDIIETLLSIEREITLWFFRATATDDQERRRMQEVLATHNRLHAGINEIVLKRVEIAGRDLAEPTAALRLLNDRIKETTKNIETAKEVIAIGAKAIEVILEVLKLVT